jgi:hypothetical protein
MSLCTFTSKLIDGYCLTLRGFSHFLQIFLGNFLKAKQGYTVKNKKKKDKGIGYIGKCRYEIQEQKKFRYGMPAHTCPLRTLDNTFNPWPLSFTSILILLSDAYEFCL